MKLSFNWNKKDKSKSVGFLLEECLTKQEAAKIKQLDLEKISLMDRSKRLEVFSGQLGIEKAKWFNSHFENIFFQNQKAALLEWAKNIETKEDRKIDILKKMSLLDRILTPADLDKFIEELVSIQLGFSLTEAQEMMITSLCENSNEALERMKQGGSMEEYEIAKKRLDDYVENLKNID